MPQTVMDSAAVMERCAPASWDSWPEVIENFMADPVDRERVEILRRELDRGPFRHPVVGTTEDEDGDCGEPGVCDGQHRLVAAFLEGRPVPVAWELDERRWTTRIGRTDCGWTRARGAGARRCRSWTRYRTRK